MATPKINFYPRPPRGGRQVGNQSLTHPNEFLSTPSARRATSERRAARAPLQISIHALREEGDCPTCFRFYHFMDFYPRPPRGGRRLSCRHLLDAVQISIHALREEGDIPVIKQYFGANAFLSTPSARRATGVSCPSMVRKANFYPRPPRGGRLLGLAAGVAGEGISIHALREEGDMYAAMSTMAVLYFYPRPPRGGRLGFRR